MAKSLILFLFFAASIGLSWSREVSRYEGHLPLFTLDKKWGEVKVVIIGEELIFIHKASLLKTLGPLLKKERLEELADFPDIFIPAALPFPIKYDAVEMKLLAEIDLELRAKAKISLRDDQSVKKKQSIRPAPFGGAINAQLEKSWGNEELGFKGLNGQFNSFLNFNSFVLENQTYYQENASQEWYRGNTRLVKDFEKQQIRAQAGDFFPRLQGFMSPYSLGGINLQREFSLDPYRQSYPTGSKSFSIKSRSLVKYFINGTLVKTEYLPTGNYSVEGIPLANGLNTIMIETTDDMGFKQYFTFNTATNINLLNQGESRFDLSYGIPFSDTDQKRQYHDEEGKVFSTFYQYGVAPDLSTSLYIQNQQHFNLTGLEAIKASPFGNISVGHARSYNSGREGDAYALGYQVVRVASRRFRSQSLSLRFENRNENFNTNVRDRESIVKDKYALSYSLPLAEGLNLSLGGNYGNVRNNDLNDRYGFDSTFNVRINSQMNLSFFLSRNRNENRIWNDVAHLFVTINFPDNNDFMTINYDQQQKTTRATYTHDNKGELHHPRGYGTVENSEYTQSGEIDLLYPTAIGNIGGRLAGRKNLDIDNSFTRGSIRTHSALAFAYQEGQWGISLSPPISGSFAIFSPEEELEDQKLSLKSTSPFLESERGIFGEISYTNLNAYQFRDIQLDPTLMDQGRSLNQEKFVLYPTYRSAHLIQLKEKGSISLRGRLFSVSGVPVSLGVGQLGGSTFFTNREGYFYIEGVEPGMHVLKMSGVNGEAPVNITDKSRGVLSLGNIHLQE